MKISMILTGHNQWSQGLISAFELINGADPNVVNINFNDSNVLGESLENYQQKLTDKVSNLEKTSDEVWICTDLIGGYPFQQGSLLSSDKVRVFGGINLMFVLATYSEQEAYQNGEELCDYILESCRAAMDVFRITEYIEEYDSDGI